MLPSRCLPNSARRYFEWRTPSDALPVEPGGSVLLQLPPPWFARTTCRSLATTSASWTALVAAASRPAFRSGLGEGRKNSVPTRPVRRVVPCCADRRPIRHRRDQQPHEPHRGLT